MIDDVRRFRVMGVDEQKVKEKLLDINPDYRITYEDGHIFNDIMVAYHA